MGAVLSWFRKKEKEESTLEKLNKLESRIRSLEDHVAQDRRKEKRVYFWFLFIAVFIYVSVAGICHAFILERVTILDYGKLALLWITPVFVIYFLQRFIPWYYERGIQENRDKLRKLREEKKKILDDVRENEPYNKAKVILEKFEGPQAPLPRPAQQAPRPVAPSPSHQKFPVGPMPTTAPRGPQPGRFAAPTPQLGYGRPPPPRQRSTFDRMLDFVVKDGPENRMALICRHCGAHNGLVMLDEFEFTGFRCFECRGTNPSRKPRPSVSNIYPVNSLSSTLNQSPSNTAVTRISGSESESSSPEEDESGQQRSTTLHQAVVKAPVFAKVEDAPVESVSTVITSPHLSDGDSGSESDNEDDTQEDLSVSAPALESSSLPEKSDLPAVVA